MDFYENFIKLAMLFFLAIGIFTSVGWLETQFTRWKRKRIQRRGRGLIGQLTPDPVAPEKLEPKGKYGTVTVNEFLENCGGGGRRCPNCNKEMGYNHSCIKEI